MQASEYAEWQRYDAEEPVGLVNALDMLVACSRQDYHSVHSKHPKSAAELMLFQRPTQDDINAKVIDGLRRMGFKDKTNG